ncbi:Ent-kaurene oxidase [Paramyrothecium foliicola]|nr:Ent-kaurene oxidase [Paramyrothecium foliicola]
MSTLLEIGQVWPLAALMKADMKASAVVIVLAAFCWWQALEVFGKDSAVGSTLLSPLRAVNKSIKAWKYLFKGQDIIQEGFEESKGQPYEVFAPDNRYVFVSSPKHIKELDQAPDTVLSLQAASKQMLQPIYTMSKFNWFDRRGTEGVGFIRALRTLLTNNLPKILPNLSAIIRTRFAEMHEQHPVVNGVKQSPVYPMIIKLVVLSNAVSFFGEGLAKNEKFMESALDYIEQTLMCAEVIRLVPKWMAPIVGRVLGSQLKAQEIIFNTLVPIAEQRVLEREMKKLGQPVPYHVCDHADCIQWIMETSPAQNPWTAKRVVHELMAIWFGSVHAVSTTITFAIHDICLHPEYTEPLLKELKEGYAEFERTGLGLPLLDSFIKESARLTPVEAQSTRRSALQPFTLSDGTKVNVGDWACTPVRAIMQNPEFYPDPLSFNGFRFASPDVVDNSTGKFKLIQPKPSKLTDVDETFHVWGTGRMACPGRFYAAAVMKVIMGQILMNYKCELINKEGPRFFEWRSTILPKSDTLVSFTPY